DSRSTGGRETVTDAVRVAAHAKLNLLLRILAREAPAGYHQIETAFALLELTDELMVTRTAGGAALTVHGPDPGAPEQNRGGGAGRRSGARARRPRRRAWPWRSRPSPLPPRTRTAGGTKCIPSPRRAVHCCSTPTRSRGGGVSDGSAAATSRSPSSGSIHRCARCTSAWPAQIPIGCGCAGRGARWPRW